MTQTRLPTVHCPHARAFYKSHRPKEKRVEEVGEGKTDDSCGGGEDFATLSITPLSLYLAVGF